MWIGKCWIQWGEDRGWLTQDGCARGSSDPAPGLPRRWRQGRTLNARKRRRWQDVRRGSPLRGGRTRRRGRSQSRSKLSVVGRLLLRRKETNPGCRQFIEDLLGNIAVSSILVRAHMSHTLIGGTLDCLGIRLEQRQRQQAIVMRGLIRGRDAKPLVIRIETVLHLDFSTVCDNSMRTRRSAYYSESAGEPHGAETNRARRRKKRRGCAARIPDQGSSLSRRFRNSTRERWPMNPRCPLVR